MDLRLRALGGNSWMGLKGRLTIGVTFVNRQSSSRSVGKPISAKRTMPAFLTGKSQEGRFSERFFSNRSKLFKYGSATFASRRFCDAIIRDAAFEIIQA